MSTETTQSLSKGTNLLDVVMYLASLASNPREIDVVMDAVRRMTAQGQGKGATSPQDTQKLQEVQKQLETYLVTKEQVRTFTHEDLQERIERRFRLGGYLAKRAKRSLIGLLLVTPLCMLALLIPQPHGLPPAIADKFGLLMVICLVITWLCVIAALQFLLGLAGFQQEVKRAYAAICVGTVFVGLGVLQLPVIVSLGWLNTPVFTSGGFMALHIISATVLFWGVCMFARRVGSKNIGRIAAIILPSAIIIAIVGGLVAGAASPFDVTPIGRLWAGALFAASAGIVLHIKRTATPIYGKAMTWFSAGLLMGAITQGIGLVLWLVGQGTSPLILVPYFVMAPLYVVAGYAFNKIREY